MRRHPRRMQLRGFASAADYIRWCNSNGTSASKATEAGNKCANTMVRVFCKQLSRFPSPLTRRGAATAGPDV